MCYRTVPRLAGRNVVELNITRDGKTATVEVDLSFGKWSQKELVRIEEVMGSGEWHDAPPSPQLVGAMVYAKLLHTPFADLTYAEIDFDLSELASFATTADEKAWVGDPAEAVVIPMTTSTGTVDAEVEIG